MRLLLLAVLPCSIGQCLLCLCFRCCITAEPLLVCDADAVSKPPHLITALISSVSGAHIAASLRYLHCLPV
jgi:hypothetical protein